MEKVGMLQCFQSYNSSEKPNCILNSWMNNGNLKAIIWSFISVGIGIYDIKLLNLAQRKSEHMRDLHRDESTMKFENVQKL